MNADGSLWKPTRWTVICQKHFLKEPSNDRLSPDYAPTQFITHKPAAGAKSEKDYERHDRITNRNKANLEDISEKVCNNELICPYSLHHKDAF